MVQFKVSALLLATVIASYGHGLVGARRHYARNVLALEFELASRGVDIEDVVEGLIARGMLDSEATENDTREVEELESRDAIGFFKDVGRFVQKVARCYWEEVKRDVSFLNMRTYVHKHEHGKGARGAEGDLESRNHHLHRHQFVAGLPVAARHLDSRKVHRHQFQDGHAVRSVEDSSELMPRMSWFSKALLIYRDIKNPDMAIEKRDVPDPDIEVIYRALLEELDVTERELEDYLDYRGFNDLYLDELD